MRLRCWHLRWWHLRWCWAPLQGGQAAQRRLLRLVGLVRQTLRNCPWHRKGRITSKQEVSLVATAPAPRDRKWPPPGVAPSPTGDLGVPLDGGVAFLGAWELLAAIAQSWSCLLGLILGARPTALVQRLRSGGGPSLPSQFLVSVRGCSLIGMVSL